MGDGTSICFDHKASRAIFISKEIPINNSDGVIIGQLRSAAFSPKFGKIVGIAMMDKDFSIPTTKFKIKLNNIIVSGEVCNLPIE